MLLFGDINCHYNPFIFTPKKKKFLTKIQKKGEGPQYKKDFECKISLSSILSRKHRIPSELRS